MTKSPPRPGGTRTGVWYRINAWAIASRQDDGLELAELTIREAHTVFRKAFDLRQPSICYTIEADRISGIG